MCGEECAECAENAFLLLPSRPKSECVTFMPQNLHPNECGMLRGGPKCGGSSPPEKVGEAAHLFRHQPEMVILFFEPRVIPAVVLIQLTAKII